MAINTRGTKLSHWAIAVKFRDGKCVKCGETGEKHTLHAHHIKTRLTHPELSLDIDNGVTLCMPCHQKEHEKSRSLRDRSTGRPQRRTIEARLDAALAEIERLQKKLMPPEKPEANPLSRHGRYLDWEKRKEYMREYMAKRRAEKRGATA